MTVRKAFSILRNHYQICCVNNTIVDYEKEVFEELFKSRKLSKRSNRLLSDLLWCNDVELKEAILTVLRECKCPPMSLRKAYSTLQKYYDDYIKIQDDFSYFEVKNTFSNFLKYKKLTPSVYRILQDLSWTCSDDVKEAIVVILRYNIK